MTDEMLELRLRRWYETDATHADAPADLRSSVLPSLRRLSAGTVPRRPFRPPGGGRFPGHRVAWRCARGGECAPAPEPSGASADGDGPSEPTAERRAY